MCTDCTAEPSPCLQQGDLRLYTGLYILKLTKTPLIYNVVDFNLGGLELCLGVQSPRSDGTAALSVSGEVSELQ